MSRNRSYHKELETKYIKRKNRVDYDESQEKEFDWFSYNYDEEPFYEEIVVDDVFLDGIPLDGHSLWNDLFENWCD